MIRRGIIKFLGWLLTIIAVSLFCFFSYHLAPIDRAQQVLQQKGIDPLSTDPNTYHTAYQQVSRDMGLDLPVFYLTLSPSYLHKDYIKENQDRLIQNLAKRKYKLIYIQEYREILEDISNQELTAEAKRTLTYLWSTGKPHYVKQNLNRLLSLQIAPEVKTKVVNLQSLHQKMQKDKIKMYYPVFSWNGLQNQYHRWVSSLLQSDKTLTSNDGRKIGDSISRSLSWTFTLVINSLIISVIIGILLAIFLHKNKKKWWSTWFNFLLNGFYAIPVFWLATLMIVFFTTRDYGTWTNIFPSPMAIISQKGEPILWQAWQNFSQLLLPIFCLVLVSLPVVVRLMINALNSEYSKPYPTALKARGLSNRRIYFRHVLPNALLPLVTMIGNYLPASLAGSLLIEIIFNIPGMGRLIYDGVFQGEIELVFVILLMITTVTSIILFLSDYIYQWLNPKIRTT